MNAMQAKTMPTGRKKGQTYKKVKTQQIDPSLCPHADRPYYANGRCRSCDLAHRRSLNGRGESDLEYSKSDKAKKRWQHYLDSPKGQAAIARAKVKRQKKSQEARKARRLKALEGNDEAM